MDISTKCVRAGAKKHDDTGAVSVPIYQSATFSHIGVGESTGYDYSRLQNPTREHLEKLIAAIESGFDAMAFSTGMAAITALFEIFSPGDEIISSDDLYGGTFRYFKNVAEKHGLKFVFVDTSDLKNIEDNITENTKALFIETPTNPMMKITDVRSAAELAKSRGILTIVDNTFLTPYLMRPFDMGADIVVHSGTKFLAGHNDTLAGFLVVNSPPLSEKLRYIYKTTGACLSPFDSWLVIRGIKTLAIRMEKSGENALKIAKFLRSRPEINKVYFPGFEDSDGYLVNKKQASGAGSMISFETVDKETALKILKKVKLILFAESLGGVETLITYPYTQTHADVPADIREARGINEKLLRISVGIENAEDLIEDLKNALEAES
jgi:Cystathionine beta-lyases/cystathionine gamma-synthases